MRRARCSRCAVAWLVLMVLVAGCTAPAAQPTAVPTPTANSGGETETVGASWTSLVDMRPVVAEFLANIPDAWGQLPAQVVEMRKPVIIDVREPDEYRQGAIQGSLNIPLRTITDNLTALPSQDKDVLLVCNTGGRAAMAMVTLQMLGWKKALSLHGGLEGWREAKLPVVTGEPPRLPKNAVPALDAGLVASLASFLKMGLKSDFGMMSPAQLEASMATTPFEQLVDPEVWEQGPPFLIDVGEPAEFSKGSIDKAINIPFRSIPDQQELIPWSTPTIVVCGIESPLIQLDRTHKYIVTVCANGHRSSVGMMIYRLLGYRDVHALEGGLKAWRAAGH